MGIEPTTSSLPRKYSTELSYVSMLGRIRRVLPTETSSLRTLSDLRAYRDTMCGMPGSNRLYFCLEDRCTTSYAYPANRPSFRAVIGLTQLLTKLHHRKCSQDRIRTCMIEKTNFTRFFGMVNIFNVMSHGPINQSPITRLPISPPD